LLSSVLTAMSGGVDSSVAAALLQEYCETVVGITMKLWDFPPAEQSPGRGCCSIEDAADAAAVAAKLGIPHYVLNLKEDFFRLVVSDFIVEYRSGRTPNPCIRCNTMMKWGALWKKKEEMNLDYIATGHYAQVKKINGEVGLYRADFREKDQSYALWGIPYHKLAGTVFPLGALSKAEVRRKAESMGLRTAKKAESQEICFIPDNDYGGFLRRQGVEIGRGEMLDAAGRVLGSHSGYIDYTIGQRKGLGGGSPYPLFVHRIDASANRIYVGPRQDTVFRRVAVDKVNWLTEEPVYHQFSALVKIRYSDAGREALVKAIDSARLSIEFASGVEAPTPGQSAVVYAGERVICGGIIASAEK